MRAGAIGIVCLYVGIGLFNWVTGLSWLAEFAWPLAGIAGLGLAIASNTPTTASNTSTADSTADLTDPIAPSESLLEADAPSSPPSPSPPSAPSISFTINKDARP